MNQGNIKNSVTCSMNHILTNSIQINSKVLSTRRRHSDTGFIKILPYANTIAEFGLEITPLDGRTSKPISSESIEGTLTGHKYLELLIEHIVPSI